MKKYSFFRVFCALLLTLTMATPTLAADDSKDWPSQLRFMAGPPGGNWFALGTALAEMWTKNTLQTTSSTGGAVANILNANTKKGDLGFTVTSFVGAAVSGEQDFQGRKADNAVVMANLYTQVTYFIMRKDFAEKHNIKSVDDMINGKTPVRFATLKPGTGSEFMVKVLFEKGYDTNFAKLKADKGWTVEYASYEGGADLIADNHLDCFAFSVGAIASIVMNIESRVPVVILPVGQKALDAVSKAYGTITFDIMPGVYKCVTSPIKTVGDYTSIVVRKDLPESLVYALNKALWENKALMAGAVKDMEELDPAMALPKGVPVHPGSLKFWTEMQKK